MDAVQSFNNVSHAIDFASVDATDENPLAVAMIFSPSKGWTFVCSKEDKDVQQIFQAFPILAATQGIEITD